jgi:hypothetical protein
VVDNVGDSVSFAMDVGFDHRVIESANVYRVGLEDRNVFGRLQQAQIYLDKAQETHGRIKLLIADWDVVC